MWIRRLAGYWTTWPDPPRNGPAFVLDATLALAWPGCMRVRGPHAGSKNGHGPWATQGAASHPHACWAFPIYLPEESCLGIFHFMIRAKLKI